jgi:hypothetical protein
MANRDFTPPMNALYQRATSAPINIPGGRPGQSRDNEVTELLGALQARLDLSVGSPEGERDRDSNTISHISSLMDALNPFRDTVSEDGARSGELTEAIKAARNFLYPDRNN